MIEVLFSIVVAFDRNNVIGSKDKIPWRLKDDLVRLRDLTKDKIVILGRKTFESMTQYYKTSSRKMPGKIYLVVTRNKKYKSSVENVLIASSVKESFEKARSLDSGSDSEVFIIGGSEIYKQALPLVNKLYVTEVDTEVTGDTFFPDLNYSEWEEINRRSFSADKRNQFNYSFVVLERR